MKKIQRISSFLLAAVMVVLSGVPAFAAPASSGQSTGAYVETALTLPKLSDSVTIMNFNAHSDGSLDLFADATVSLGRRQGSKVSYLHWRSADNGKTWMPQNTDWTTGNILSSVFVDENKEIWGLVRSPDTYKTQIEHERFGMIDTSYDVFNVFKVVNGKMQKIPNTAFNEEKQIYHKVSGILPTKELVITCLASLHDKNAEGQVFVVDPTTGATKKQFGTGNSSAGRLSGSIIYTPQKRGPEMLVKGRSYSAYDVNTGKLLQTGKFPQLPYNEEAGADGSYYMVDKIGIYSLAAGAKSFVKLVDGASTALGSEQLEPLATCSAPDGAFYVILRNHTANTYSLYRYGTT